MGLDLFGIKIGMGEGGDLPEATLMEYRITKAQLLQKLGFTPEKVTFIAYDYKTGILTIKSRR